MHMEPIKAEGEFPETVKLSNFQQYRLWKVINAFDREVFYGDEDALRDMAEDLMAVAQEVADEITDEADYLRDMKRGLA